MCREELDEPRTLKCQDSPQGRAFEHPAEGRGNCDPFRAYASVRSVAKQHIEDIPALAACGLNDWRCRVLIGNSRDAISVDLPVTRRGAVGRQELRLAQELFARADGVDKRRAIGVRLPGVFFEFAGPRRKGFDDPVNVDDR